MLNSDKSSRRAFLRGESSGDQAFGNVDNPDVAENGESAYVEDDAYLFQMARRAMACDFELLLNVGQYPQGADTAFEALNLVEELESQLTVYRDTSEVSQLNRTAHLKPVIVEQRLFELLQLAAAIHEETRGAYDICTGALSKLWGFYNRAGRLPSETEIAEALDRVGMLHLKLDAENHAVQFNRAGLEINLGSIGKGYALDRAAEMLHAAGVDDYLIHGGHSSIVARGSRGSGVSASTNCDSAIGGWWIGLRHPLLPKLRIIEVRLCNAAIGTSGGGTQFFVHEGRGYSHILDPRTGRPAEGTLSVSVVAPTGAEADALATAFFVMGKEATIEYCRTHSGIAALIASPIAGSSRCEIAIYGVRETDIRISADDSILIQKIER
jgi:FAD:protein FMN transferase